MGGGVGLSTVHRHLNNHTTIYYLVMSLLSKATYRMPSDILWTLQIKPRTFQLLVANTLLPPGDLVMGHDYISCVLVLLQVCCRQYRCVPEGSGVFLTVAVFL